MKNLKILSSFDIRIIAMITMVIDHIGYFFYYMFDDNTYNIFRSIGRLSMPLFVFLIYQGYKHTKNLKKYIYRLIELAIFTQVVIIVTGIIINSIDNSYAITYYRELNIVFSFAICLLLLEAINRFLGTKKKSESFIYFFTIIAILSMYMLIDIEYGLTIPFFIMSLFLYDKISRYKKLYVVVLFFIFFMIFADSLMKYSIFSIIPILMYNGKKGYDNKKLFYYFYPAQYIILNILGFIMYIN